MIGKVPIAVAAEILGMSAFSVQCGLRTGKLPIGTCWKNEGSSCYVYKVSPRALACFQGISVEEIERRVIAYKEMKGMLKRN